MESAIAEQGKMKQKTIYRVVGVMSGTSLDGLDLVLCEFRLKRKNWSFDLIAGETIRYSPIWNKRLSIAHLLPGVDLQKLDNEFGAFIGSSCNTFIKRHKIRNIDFIASHGHTVFHQPKKKLTYQIGNGMAIHTVTHLPVVNDFRSLDVLRGGEGAPLVPVGDHYLFFNYDVCLNLGGIANLSMLKKKKRVAFDICFVNMALNYLASKMNKKFDKDGKEAASGSISENLLSALKKANKTFTRSRPSLGREMFEELIQPELDSDNTSLRDKLRTHCESVCQEIAAAIPKSKKRVKVLVTGGGAFNRFLVELLRSKVDDRADIIVPEDAIVNFKEAIVFGFLGVRKVRGETNVLKSVTGASMDSCSGVLVGFKSM